MGWLFDVLGISVDGFVSSIFNGIINWIYEVIFSVIKVVFTKINETGSDLFRLPWVQSLVNFFYILGWALFAIGLVVSISDMVIEYSNGKGDVKTTAINWLKAVLAVSLFTILPERLFTSFMQTTLFFTGLITIQSDWLIGTCLILSATEVPRIADRFGLDTSIRGNMMAVSMTANTALSGMRFIRAVAK